MTTQVMNGVRLAPRKASYGQAPSWLEDCRICRAPNRPGREGCWNCGSLLEVRPLMKTMVRDAIGEVEAPGRVRYVLV